MFDRCPRCGEPLKPGFVRGGGAAMIWTPFQKRGPTDFPLWMGEFELPNQGGRLSGAKCPARRCEKCGLILIETNEEEST